MKTVISARRSALRRRVSIVAGAALALGAIVATAPSAPVSAEAPTVLYVAGNPARLPGGDVAPRNELEAMGFDVVVVDDDDVVAADAAAARLIVISTSVSPSKVGNLFTDTAVPVLTWEPSLYDDLGMTSSSGQIGSQTRLTLGDPHPISALTGGPTDVVTVSTRSTGFSFGVPSSEAAIIARAANNANRAVVFAYDTGNTMVDGVAPARRVAMFSSFSTPRYWNDAGALLFRNAVIWATDASALVNRAPLVTVPDGQTVVIGDQIALTGSVVDDDLPSDPGTVTTQWNVPAGVTVDNPAAAATVATFWQAGTFTLSLEATDGELSATADTTFVVRDPATIKTALFIIGSDNVTANDAPIVARLNGLGYDVVTSDDNDTVAADSGDFDIVVISATIAGYRLDDDFASLEVPIVVWEHQVYDELGFTPSAGRSGSANQSMIDIENVDNPIVDGGEVGRRAVYVRSDQLSWAKPEGDVSVLATLTNTDTKATLFTYERGAQMANFPAPARRVGMFLGLRGAQRLNDPGWEMFDAAIDWAAAATPSTGRTSNGLTALYDFAESGDSVSDVSGVGDPLDLVVTRPDDVTWLPGGGLRLDIPTVIVSAGPATKVTAALGETSELTVEAWIDPLVAVPSVPGRIVTISPSDAIRNMSISQGSIGNGTDQLEARLVSERSTEQGYPAAESPEGSLGNDLVHVVFTRDATGLQTIWLDGEIADQAIVGGDFSGWDESFPLAIGADPDGLRPWAGDFHLVALYDRALDRAEVCQNLGAGPGRATSLDNLAPLPCLDVDVTTGQEPLVVQVSAVGSTDPDGTIASVDWDFGDGATATTENADGSLSHTYATGDHVLTLTVTDDAGSSKSTSVPIVVRDAAVLPPRPANFDETFGFRASGGLFDLDEFIGAEIDFDQSFAWTTQFTDRGGPQAMVGNVNTILNSPDSTLPGLVDRLDLSITIPLGFGNATAHGAAGREQIRQNLENTAAGVYDVHYTAAAQALVDGGYDAAVVRLAHEFDGAWPPYSSRENETEFIAAWRHVHGVLTAVSPDFRFEWNTTRGGWQDWAVQAYPGDDVVDIISMDLYWKVDPGDASWNQYRWDTVFQANLESQFAFAVEHGKPVAVAEWGLIGTDEPRFVEAMYNWLAGLPTDGPGSLVYQAYFDSGQSKEKLADHPNARSTFIELFTTT